jgi:hypothetical protein
MAPDARGLTCGGRASDCPIPACPLVTPMQLHTAALTFSLCLAGPAQAVSLFESGGFTQAAAGAVATGSVTTGSSEGVRSSFTLAQRSTVERIVFGSALDADALDPLNHRVLPVIDIRSGSGVAYLGTSYEREAGASVAAGSPFNLVSFQMGGLCTTCSLVLEAGTYQISWAGGDAAVMPTYTVPGDVLVRSNPLGSTTQADTALVFQVQGVSAVPESQTWALMLAGLAGVVVLGQRRAGAAGQPRC